MDHSLKTTDSIWASSFYEEILRRSLCEDLDGTLNLRYMSHQKRTILDFRFLFKVQIEDLIIQHMWKKRGEGRWEGIKVVASHSLIKGALAVFVSFQMSPTQLYK